jgi:hypothetical protein
MKLNTLVATGHRYKHWCGPSAVAIITGRTLKFCHNKFAKLRGKEPRYIKGVYNSEMRQVLREMGYSLEEIRIERINGSTKPTLANWIDTVQTTDQFRSVVLLNVTNHYVVAHRGMVCDNKQPNPVPAREHKSARQQIVHAWIVSKIKPTVRRQK